MCLWHGWMCLWSSVAFYFECAVEALLVVPISLCLVECVQPRSCLYEYASLLMTVIHDNVMFSIATHSDNYDHYRR